MKTYRVLQGATFGTSDQFKGGEVLPPNYLTDKEAEGFLGYKLEIVPDGASGNQQPSLLGQPGENGQPRGQEQQPAQTPHASAPSTARLSSPNVSSGAAVSVAEPAEAQPATHSSFPGPFNQPNQPNQPQRTERTELVEGRPETLDLGKNSPDVSRTLGEIDTTPVKKAKQP